MEIYRDKETMTVILSLPEIANLLRKAVSLDCFGIGENERNTNQILEVYERRTKTQGVASLCIKLRPTIHPVDPA